MSPLRRRSEVVAPFGTGLVLALLDDERDRVLASWAPRRRIGRRAGGSDVVPRDVEHACRATETWLDLELAVIGPWQEEFADEALRRRLRLAHRRSRRLAVMVDACRARAVPDPGAVVRQRRHVGPVHGPGDGLLRRHTATTLALLERTIGHSPPACEQLLLRELVDRLAADRSLEILLT